MYSRGFRFNLKKEELYKEKLNKDEVLVFHGSKNGLKEISPLGSREKCDLGYGFYCGETFVQAADFVFDAPFSSIYCFKANLKGLKIITFKTCLDWMLMVCYFRRMIDEYKEAMQIKNILNEISGADLIIAPIANNKMFQVMRQFGEGEITTIQAMHALSSSSLGNQIVFKTQKSIDRLFFWKKLYLCEREREAYKKKSLDRANLIETMLKLSRRQFRTEGKFIDELF